jgi:GntR family transcriptional regulator
LISANKETAHAIWVARIFPALLDDGMPTPLYHQIYLVLRNLIQTGTVAADTLLPGEKVLAELFDVSRITVKRALNELAAENFVSRHRGLGTVVVGRPALPVVRSSFDNLLESLHQMGLATELEMLDAQEVLAGDAGVYIQMGLEPDAPLQKVVRRRKLEGEPLSYLVTFTPKAIAKRYEAEVKSGASSLALLERAGADALEAEQWITAVCAEPHVASALGVNPGAPLLKIERVLRDASGETVQLIEGFYRPDRFQYHVLNYSPRVRGVTAHPAIKDDS